MAPHPFLLKHSRSKQQGTVLFLADTQPLQAMRYSTFPRRRTAAPSITVLNVSSLKHSRSKPQHTALFLAKHSRSKPHDTSFFRAEAQPLQASRYCTFPRWNTAAPSFMVLLLSSQRNSRSKTHGTALLLGKNTAAPSPKILHFPR
jgi:hypothetical protein